MPVLGRACHPMCSTLVLLARPLETSLSDPAIYARLSIGPSFRKTVLLAATRARARRFATSISRNRRAISREVRQGQASATTGREGGKERVVGPSHRASHVEIHQLPLCARSEILRSRRGLPTSRTPRRSSPLGLTLAQTGHDRSPSRRYRVPRRRLARKSQASLRELRSRSNDSQLGSACDHQHQLDEFFSLASRFPIRSFGRLRRVRHGPRSIVGQRVRIVSARRKQSVRSQET